MVEKTPIKSEIGFADSELQSYRRDEGLLVVSLSAWNEQTILLRFEDPIFVVDRGAGDVSDVCEIKEPGSLLDEALRIQYEELPTEHPYRLFQFLNVDGEPSIEIVAASVEITVEQ